MVGRGREDKPLSEKVTPLTDIEEAMYGSNKIILFHLLCMKVFYEL